MLTVKIPKELEDILEALAKETKRSKGYYVRKALATFLEDREDYAMAMARLKDKSPRIPLEKVRKELGLED